MVKLQDFAREMGVTDRAIQKHLKNYADELVGLYERKGPNGTWLTDEACEILRGKMRRAPIVIFDEDPRIKQLEARLETMQQKLDEKEKLLAMAQESAQRAQDKVFQLQEEAGKVKALEEGRRTLTNKVTELEEEKAEALRQAAEAEIKAQEIQKELEIEEGAKRKLAERAVSAEQQLTAAKKRFEDKTHLLEQELEAEKQRSISLKEWWQRKRRRER